MFNSNNYTFIDIGLKSLFLEFIFDLPEIFFLDDNRINNKFIKKYNDVYPYDINNKDDKFISLNSYYELFDIFENVKDMIIQIGNDLYDINPLLYSYINPNGNLYAIIEYIYIKSNKGYCVTDNLGYTTYILNLTLDDDLLTSINNLPAKIEYQFNQQIRFEKWYKKGNIHREDTDKAGKTLPAGIAYYNKNDQIKYETWYKDGKSHRDDKDENGNTLPAVKEYDENGQITLEVYKRF
jgi:antitoxin component YwqK of YwqJK toxin-antitoxin module